MALIFKRKMQIFMWKLRLATICARYGAPKLALWVLVYNNGIQNLNFCWGFSYSLFIP